MRWFSVFNNYQTWYNIVIAILGYWSLHAISGLKGIRVFTTNAMHSQENVTSNLQGDITLRMLFGMTRQEKDGCRFTKATASNYANVEAILYALERINQRNELLPGINIGYKLTDGCQNTTKTVYQALRILPKSFHWVHAYELEEDQYLKEVIGIITWNQIKLVYSPVSFIFGNEGIPQMSFSPGSIGHADHPALVRSAHSALLWVEHLVKFIKRHDWNYFSVIYSRSGQEFHVLHDLEEYLQNDDLCIAEKYDLGTSFNKNHYENIVTRASVNIRARVVILFCSIDETIKVFETVQRLNKMGMFIWIQMSMQYMHNPNPSWSSEIFYGSFALVLLKPSGSEFIEYISSFNPYSQLRSKVIWEVLFDCSVQNKTCDNNLNLFKSTDFYISINNFLAMDTVYAFAHAMHELLVDICSYSPHAIQTNKQAIIECLQTNRNLISSYLRNVSFIVHTGLVRFGESGNRDGNATVYQYQHKSNGIVKEVAWIYSSEADSKSKEIEIGPESWTFLKQINNSPSLKPAVNNESIPLSVCSTACGRNELILYTSKCCWDCIKCEPFEIIVDNKSRCKVCPYMHLPDISTNMTSCVKIKTLNGVSLLDWIFIGTACILLIVTAMLLVILNYYEKKITGVHDSKLQTIQLYSIGVGFVSVILFAAPVSDIVCILAHICWILSVVSVFATLVIISGIWIYFIYEYNLPEAFRGKAIFMSVILSIQIIFCTITISVENFRPKANIGMINEFDQETYMYCKISKFSLLSGMCMIILLICFCCLGTCAMRKDDFQFKKPPFYISLCIFMLTAMTFVFVILMLMTISNLPTYIGVVYILLNNSITIILLFVVPRCMGQYNHRTNKKVRKKGTIRSRKTNQRSNVDDKVIRATIITGGAIPYEFGLTAISEVDSTDIIDREQNPDVIDNNTSFSTQNASQASREEDFDQEITYSVIHWNESDESHLYWPLPSKKLGLGLSKSASQI